MNQQTQWSAQDALKRHHVDAPEDGMNTLIGDAVNEGWESSDNILRTSKPRPN
ncbi:hypothetical protein ACFYO5_31695 [Streptomyces sp. NPDC006259]|uniref:hypothetical protein n=1 Tax=Streptomyces sp. NPDC006259 TaxID=3364740 RepID=UPI003699264C